MAATLELPQLSADSDNPYKAGSYVVGSYNILGKPLKDGGFVGSEASVRAAIKLVADHQKAHGTQNVIAPKKEKKSRKKVEVLDNPIKLRSLESIYVPLDDHLKPTPVDAGPVAEGPAYRPQDAQVSNVVKKTISFSNQFGQIKLKVIDVLDSEGFGIALVFESDDDLTFIPRTGETLQFKDNDGKISDVYFPGLIFNWTDSNKRVMILIKPPEGEPDATE